MREGERNRISLSGVTLSRTTSSGNSVRNLLSSPLLHVPSLAAAMPCPLLPSFLSSDSEMPTTFVLWHSVFSLSIPFRGKPSVMQCGVVIPTSLTFALLDSRFFRPPPMNKTLAEL